MSLGGTAVATAAFQAEMFFCMRGQVQLFPTLHGLLKLLEVYSGDSAAAWTATGRQFA